MSASPLLPSALDRRGFLRTLAGAGAFLSAGGLLTACSSSSGSPGSAASPATGGSELGTLRIGYLPITDAAPLLVAHGDGLLTAQGIESPDPTLFRSWAGIVEAFQAGQVDVVHLLMPLAIQLRFGAELPVKVLSWNHTNGSALTVQPDIDSIDALAGTTVAVPFWFSIHNVVLQQLLRDRGLTAIIEGEPSVADQTVKLVVMGPPDMPPALANGSIAGFIVADPFNALAETSEVGKVLRFTGDVWRDHACCVTVVNESLITDRPDTAQALVNALAEAQLSLRSDPVANARLLSERGYLPQPLPAIERALAYYDLDEYGTTGAIAHPEWGSERIGFQPFPYPTYTAELVEALRETVIDGDTAFLDSIDLATAHEELVAVGLAEGAIDHHGGPEKFGLTGLSRTESISP